jgi:intracellular sulfur oxidation DsrE/DsrF family protein
MSPDRISEEVLNAFVDGQLEAAERLRVLDASRRDPQLAERICALNQTKDLVRTAFAEPPPPRSRERRGAASTGLGLSVAALLILTLGSLAGWIAHGYLAAPLGFQLAHRGEKTGGRFILHLADSEPARMEAVLSDTEALFRRFDALHRPVQAEVVVNGEGLALLNAATSPYGQRIRALMQRYQGVSFLACAEALERMRLQGQLVRLLPQARVIEEGALERIISRLQEGWSYIRV